MNPKRSTVSLNFQDSAVYWFACYEKAVTKGDLSSARTARDHLNRLGYSIGPHRRARAPRGQR